MEYNFDEHINRYGTYSVKYDTVAREYNDPEIIGMRIADSDFAAPANILEALKKTIDNRVLGYSDLNPEMYINIVAFYEKMTQWKINPAWMHVAPGILSVQGAAIQAFTQEGDQILFHAPGYGSIYQSIIASKREPLISEMIYNETTGEYSLDFEDMEQKITPKTKMMIFCNPHNPTGRVWTKEELQKLGEICLKHNIIILSDEIQGFLNFSGHTYTPFASISKEIENITITAGSPGKLFEVPGAVISFFIIANEELKKKFFQAFMATGALFACRNFFGLTCLRYAYSQKNEEWLKQKIAYIEKSATIVDEFFKANLPKIIVTPSESTFIKWINFRSTGLTDTELQEKFIKEAHIALLSGKEFGAPGFIRMNIGCTHLTLKDALSRLFQAFHQE